MKKLIYKKDWPESWKSSYKYDLIEIYGDKSNKGYSYAYDKRREAVLNFISSIAKPRAKILDVAAAQGNFSLTLAERGYDVVWNDIRNDLDGYVKLKCEKGKIKYLPGNIFDLNFKDKFDVVLATEIIEHVAHPDLFLEKISGFG